MKLDERLDELYENYASCVVTHLTLTKGEFFNKFKNDEQFAKTWGKLPTDKKEETK